MSRPGLEVADIFRDHGAAWRRANAGHVSLDQMKVMSAIERCRTAALGGHVARCQDCSHTVIAYNSCLMGKFRNGELAAWLDGNLPAFRVSTLINVPFAPHYNGASRDSRVARSRFGRHGVFGMSLCRTCARHHGNLHERSVEAIGTLLHCICAKKAFDSRQAERPAQGLLVMESENSPNLRSIRCFRAPAPHYKFCP
jgi:Transposase zinc-binding domain